MPTEAPARTHCPNCGAKIHRQDLSLCAYCATPLSLGGAVDASRDELAQRVARLREHAAFGTAMKWTPPDPATETRNRPLATVGWLLVVAAPAAYALAAARSDASEGAGNLPWILAAVPAVLGVVLIAAARAKRAPVEKLPLLRRPALVVVRRSETEMKRGPGATTYFFTLHFDDGSEGEFRWPGQGTLYEPMPNGTTGIAYTRGDRLIDFRKL